MTQCDRDAFDVESSIAPDVTIPAYRASRPVRRPWWRVLINRNQR